jgi:WsaF, C-terminal domain/WsaF, N-terminal domain
MSRAWNMRGLSVLPKKIQSQGRLLVQEPARFVENIEDTIRPEKYRKKLLGFESMPPIEVRTDGDAPPHCNVLVPALEGRLTGGFNTVFNIASGLAGAGIPVRLLATDGPVPADVEALRRHIASVAGAQKVPSIAFGSTIDPTSPAQIGARDMFLASAWTTAYRLKPVLPRMQVKEFVYLIQDFEPAFYPWSSSYAQALETYSMPFRALINEQLLADYLADAKVGRFAEPGFLSRCAIFEPAVDRQHFHPVDKKDSRRQLLFYARPKDFRNLFGIGFEALSAAASHPRFKDADWRFVAIGATHLLGKIAVAGRIALGEGQFLHPAPWLNFKDYAQLIRESDVLLCPMLSPHTSYPVLEMAASGKTVVTNTFGSKTEERLRQISSNIIATAPTVEGFRDGLIAAAERAATGWTASTDIAFPTTWREALQDTLVKAGDMFRYAAGDARP